MIDIIEYLKKRIEYSLYSGEDLWIQKLIDDYCHSYTAFILSMS